MKETSHKIHGDVLQAGSFSDLISNVCEPQDDDPTRVWMWRGQSDIDWRIDSSAFRRLNNSTNYQTTDKDKDLISYEKTLLDQATHKGFRYENGRKLSDFELLAKLQHHGAATRLVDFSRSLLVGLFFACNQNLSKSGLLIGFHTWYIAGYEKELEERSYFEVVKELDDITPVTWEPPGISPRIAVQHSQFMYSAVSNHRGGSLCLPEENRYRLIKITPKVKHECLDILTEVFDIDQSILFPDIDGFSDANSVNEDIHRMHRW